MMSTSAGESGGDDNGSDGKRSGKRELSTSKRAAQNRAAQVRVQLFSSVHCLDDVVNRRMETQHHCGNFLVSKHTAY